MRCYRLLSLLTLAPVLTLLSGCGKSSNVDDDIGGPNVGGTTTTQAAVAVVKTPIEAKEVAVLKGVVTFEGTPPGDDGALKKQMGEHKDKNVCLAGNANETSEFVWRVNPDNKGVENVVVWVKPPDNKYFKPNTPEEKAWKKDDVVVDQPHCAFEPHVSIAFAGYFDGKEKVPSGQKTIVKNSAPVIHNTAWAGNKRLNPGGNPTLQPGTQEVLAIKADPQTVITLGCNVHQWMKGYLWALDTPYFAKTNKDGKFEIAGVPAGSEVYVVKWHEQPGFLGSAQGEKITLKPGDNEMNFTVKPK